MFHLLTFSMASSAALASGTSGLPGSPVQNPSPYFIEQYIAHEGARHDVWRFISVTSYLGRPSIVHNHHARDTAAGAWRKR